MSKLQLAKASVCVMMQLLGSQHGYTPPLPRQPRGLWVPGRNTSLHPGERQKDCPNCRPPKDRQQICLQQRGQTIIKIEGQDFESRELNTVLILC